MDKQPAIPTSDERLLASLGHFLGLWIALIVFLLQRERSRFVRFQAAQAMAFSLSVTVLSTFLFACVFGLMMIGIVATGVLGAAAAEQQQPEAFLPVIFAMSFLSPGIILCIFPYSLLILATRLIAGISVLTGKDFHYPVLGRWVESFLSGD